MVKALFQILHLLTHLFDQKLEFHRRISEFGGGRFGAERIRLAIEFLHHEVEAFTDGPTGIENAPGLGQMGGQARELFCYVDPHTKQSHLLTDSIEHFLAGQGGTDLPFGIVLRRRVAMASIAATRSRSMAFSFSPSRARVSIS